MIRRTALITGASRGIGRACALAMARDGFEVWINYLTHEAEATEVLDTINTAGGKAHLLPFDVADPVAMEEAVLPLVRKKGFYALVQNAGIIERSSIVMIKGESISRMLAVNLESLLHLARIVVRGMIHAREGRIVIISSIAGVRGIPGQVCYSASKAGLLGATYSLAQELGRFGILVNSVVPGLIKTVMSEGTDIDGLPYIPLGRAGTPEEVAEVVAFLCSDKASYISGGAIPVTGGLLA